MDDRPSGAHRQASGYPHQPQGVRRACEDLEGLVNAGMQVQRLLVNNMRPVTADDARKLYQEIM